MSRVLLLMALAQRMAVAVPSPKGSRRMSIADFVLNNDDEGSGGTEYDTDYYLRVFVEPLADYARQERTSM